MIPDPSDELLRNLPVIEKLDLYSNVESVEFLRELDKRIVSFNEPQIKQAVASDRGDSHCPPRSSPSSS